MILSRRPNDDDSRDGFTKWPFMTTHTWGEDPRGRWTLEVKTFDCISNLNDFLSLNFFLYMESKARFNSPSGAKQSGWLREWTLMLHGTRDAPYVDLPAGDKHSKLAIVKKAHEERLKVRK